MTYFVRTEFQAAFLKTHTVAVFDNLADAVDFAISQTGDDVVSVKLYTNAE